MTKIKMAIFLTLLSIISMASIIQIVHGFSQTTELNQGVYSGIADFNLNVGDHVEGSFSVSNLGPYERLFGNGTSYEVVGVWVIDPNGHPPNGNSILNFSSTPNENSFNFSFTAHQQGLYQMWAFSGAMDYLKNAQNPVMTLNYNITYAYSPSPTPTVPEFPTKTVPDTDAIPISTILNEFIFVVVIILAVVVFLLLYRRHRKTAKPNQ